MAVLSLILLSIGFLMSVCIYCCSSFQILMGGKFTCWLVPFIWMRLYADSNVLLVALCISRFVVLYSPPRLQFPTSWQSSIGRSMSMRLQIGDYSFYCHILSLLMLKIRMLGDPIVQSRSMGYLCYPSFSVGSTNKATFLQEAELFCMWHDRDIITVAEISYFLSYCPCLECPKIGFIWKNKYGWWFGTWLLFSISYMGCHPSWRTHIFQDGWNAPPTRYRLTISYLVDITNIAVENHHFLVGKSTISMAICNSKLLIITRDIAIDNSPLYHY